MNDYPMMEELPIDMNRNRRGMDPAGTEKRWMNTGAMPARDPDRVAALRGPELPAPRVRGKIRRDSAGRIFLGNAGLPAREREAALRRRGPLVAERQDRPFGGLPGKSNGAGNRPGDLWPGRHADEGGS